MYACVCDWLGFPYREEVQWVSTEIELVASIFSKLCKERRGKTTIKPQSKTKTLLFTILRISNAKCSSPEKIHLCAFSNQDVDTIYLTQDTRELNLQDFSHLDHR